MSSFEHLFLDPGHDDVERAAAALAERLPVEVERRNGRIYLASRGLTIDRGHVAGRLEANTYTFENLGPDDPAEAVSTDFSIYDDMPLLWGLWSATEGGDEGEVEQRRRGRIVFDMVVERLGWRAILVHEFDELVATYDPEHGVREFPPGTPADGTGRHLWAPGSP